MVEENNIIYCESAEYFPEELRKEYNIGEHTNKSYKFVNAHINNISFPKTIEQLENFIYVHGCYNVEDVVYEAGSLGYTTWTVPRSSALGDIVLYYHASTAIQWIRKLETATKSLDEARHDKRKITEWLQRARTLYNEYGGKIFAIGRISSKPEKDDWSADDSYHWTGRIYADVNDLYLLETPVHISEFNSFILVSRQSAITPLPAREFEMLKRIIIKKNNGAPKWFSDGKIGDYNLSKVTKENFLEYTSTYRKRFLLESDFRSYYVDHFLRAICGRRFYRECQCHTEKSPLARVDNVFEFDGKKILLEVKLNIALENDLFSQLDQYIQAEYICLKEKDSEKIYDFEKSFMFVVDVYCFYKYDPYRRCLVKLFSLDELKDLNDIVKRVKEAL